MIVLPRSGPNQDQDRPEQGCQVFQTRAIIRWVFLGPLDRVAEEQPAEQGRRPEWGCLDPLLGFGITLDYLFLNIGFQFVLCRVFLSSLFPFNSNFPENMNVKRSQVGCRIRPQEQAGPCLRPDQLA